MNNKIIKDNKHRKPVLPSFSSHKFFGSLLFAGYVYTIQISLTVGLILKTLCEIELEQRNNVVH